MCDLEKEEGMKVRDYSVKESGGPPVRLGKKRSTWEKEMRRQLK